MLFINIYFLVFSSVFSEVYINVGEPSFVKPNFAYYTTCKLDYCSQILDIIQNDLDFANVFSFVPEKTYPKDEEKDLITNWSASGTKYLLKLDYKNNYFLLNFFQVENNKKLFEEKVYRLPGVRKTANKISSLVYTFLTGKKSIFNTKIAFIGIKNKRKNLFTMDFDGKNLKQITYFKSIMLSPTWSPDGRYIAYSRYRSILRINKKTKKKLIKTSLDLLFWDLKLKKETLVASGGQNSGASWSPNGKYIIFTSSHRGDPDLYVYNIKSRKIIRLLKQRGIDVEPSYAPNGKEIVFSSSKFGNPHIFTLNLKNKKDDRLTYQGHYNSSPEWSPTNEKQIAFAGLDDPFSKGKSLFDIFLIYTDTKKIERLTINAGNNEDPSFSPDGRHLVFSSTRDGGSNIFFINEDGTNVRRLRDDILSYSPSWSSYFD